VRLLTVIKPGYDAFSELSVFRRYEEGVTPDNVLREATPE
jgi:hypothetical protein